MMRMPFKAVKINENIWWVGAIDWNLRNFHGYITPRGSTYNAYLIIDDKIALIDTVKEPFAGELIDRISSVVSTRKIDYVISNHVEMDHSGSLKAIREAAPNAKFVADKRAAEDIKRHFKTNWDFQLVKTGDGLSLGKRSLSFVEMPMVHWPDSMATYCPEEESLFPNDAFGQHLASTARFDDEFPWEEVRREAAKYYANIVFPFDGPVKKALGALSKLKIRMIAPSHGIIWRKHVDEIVSCYGDWASNKTANKAVVLYDTMWNSTDAMAKAIAEGFKDAGVEVHLFNLRTTDTTEVMTEILDSRMIAVGSPTLNNGMMPTVSAFLTYMKGLKPKNRIGFAFGSHGWAGGGTKAVEEMLVSTGFELAVPAIDYKYIPDEDELNSCYETALKVAK